MLNKKDKYVIECWLKLYNRLKGTSYAVVDWPDSDSSKKNIDAICHDNTGNELAIEHTLIQPFEGEKADSAIFMKTLASLTNHPDLLQPGYTIMASQPVGIPTGINWNEMSNELLAQLKTILPNLQLGLSTKSLRGRNWTLDFQFEKIQTDQMAPGKLLAGRTWPGNPGPELVIRAIKEKIPKLSKYKNARRILLLEQDSIAGTTDSQFEQMPDDPALTGLLQLVDEIWSAKTAGLETESVIFTNQLWPEIGTNRCSLDLNTGKFWKGPC